MQRKNTQTWTNLAKLGKTSIITQKTKKKTKVIEERKDESISIFLIVFVYWAAS